MLFRTHLAFSFLIALYLINLLKIKNQIPFIIILLFFSIFPDIDQPTSKISRKLKPFSYFTAILGHRNILHTIYFPIAISLILLVFNLKILSLAAITGYLLHLILDSTTKKGIALFYPLSKKRIKGIIKTGSITENIISIILIILIIFNLFSI